jgi:N-methylhydantoinase B
MKNVRCEAKLNNYLGNPGQGDIMASKTVDPIKLEILSSAYKSVTEECFISLMKSAYSTNIKERKDHSTAIMDAGGRLIMQTMVSPIHIAAMTASLATVLEKYGNGLNGGINPGDIFVGNDPHVAGGTHLPDVNLTTSVFDEGRLIGFILNIAHHADIGGMAPGSMIGGMTEIYQEGLRIPPIKLFDAGELQQDIMDLLLLNARLPEERKGDYYAQIAACRLGVRRMAEILDTHGTDAVLASFDELISRTARRTRNLVRGVKDGETSFSDVMDCDGRDVKDIPIKLKIKIRDDQITFDFTGTSPQVQGNVNTTLNATEASVCFAFQAMLDLKSGLVRCSQDHRPQRYAAERQFPGCRGQPGAYLPAHYRRCFRGDGRSHT